MMKLTVSEKVLLAGAGLIVSRCASRTALVMIAGATGLCWWRKSTGGEGLAVGRVDDAGGEVKPEPLAHGGLVAEGLEVQATPEPYLPPINGGRELPDEVDLGE